LENLTNLNIIKRSGKVEKFNVKKIKKAVNWCCKENEVLTKALLNDLKIKVSDNIKIETLWDEVISTSANKISQMFPGWDEVAARAYLIKLYKNTYNNNRIKNVNYPDYISVIKKGISSGVYNKEIFNYLTEDEVQELGDTIEPKRDLTFSYIGLRTIIEKYSMNQTVTKKLELPQHIYMRVAIQAFMMDTSKDKLKKIKKRYNDLSLFRYTEATPKMINSLSCTPQLASCVLQEVDDSTLSINNVDAQLSLFSKYGGGLALDVSKIRCSASLIGKNGARSDGPIPFIKKYEATVGAFNQGGRRKGALIITFPFWHYDSPDMVMLKDAGGSESNRARKLQYSIRWHNIFTKRILANEDITLFDPKETPELNNSYGEEFNKWYKFYENKNGIRKKKIKARELAFLIIKIRAETGNLYIIFPDNVNRTRMTEETVMASNLCMEVLEHVRAASNFKKKILVDYSTNKPKTILESDTGETALCNLTSINLLIWVDLSEKDKIELMDNLLEASDNLIEYQFYPVPEGEYSNKLRRYIGIGQLNYAALLADSGILFTDKKAEEFTQDVYEDLSYHIYSASMRLAKARGPVKTFSTLQWSKGISPVDLLKCNMKYPLKRDWISLKNDIKKYGVRFSLHMATAPNQTSGQIIQATEGIEPIKQIFQMKEGTYTAPVIVPNLIKNREFYQSAFDIPNATLNTLNSIRQPFIDQSQSFSHYSKSTNSAYDILNDILDAESKNIKTLYYLQTMKSDTLESCELCSA